LVQEDDTPGHPVAGQANRTGQPDRPNSIAL
jgi:hypothetical protein